MSGPESASPHPSKARLFPLPDLVMFPHVVQPLHLFEPRYVAMVEDAMSGDRIIAMALLQEGWQSEYFEQPPIHDTVCLGRIISDSPLEDGRHNVLLAGLSRAQVVRELAAETPYRTATVVLQPDLYGAADSGAQRRLQQQLLTEFRALYPSTVSEDPSFRQLLQEQVPLAMLTDVIAYALPLSLTSKQRLLSCPMVTQRAETLLTHLERLQQSGTEQGSGSFPPPFSDN